jgi:hypothetical protein
MDEWFDGLAKDSARTLSRRQVIARVAGGMGAAMLAVFGIRARAAEKDKEQCGKLCVECCKNNFPRGGPEFAECVRQCHDGEGICGPIVCPQD